MCRYLQVEWDVKKKTPNSLKEKIRGSTPRVPQQTNFSDCGVYVLQYVESFFKVCTRGIWKVMHIHPYNFTQWSEKKDEGISVNVRIWGF